MSDEDENETDMAELTHGYSLAEEDEDYYQDYDAEIMDLQEEAEEADDKFDG